MSLTRRQFFQLGIVATALTGCSWLTEPAAQADPLARVYWHGAYPQVDEDPALHLLRRASFGPTRAELERVRTMGVHAWIEEQLTPETLDDSTLETALQQKYPTLTQSASELRELENPSIAYLEMAAATLERAVYSKRQLFQLMVDYWSNHFSVYAPDGALRVLKPVEDREVIRAHALDSFQELLTADARSPAMLVYLDNVSNRAGAPNENYGRELMELHTLGVDGGYTEQDVKEVARAFTGWTVDRRKGTFIFRSRWHDRDPKTILGHELPPGRGVEDGEDVLKILAQHPSTAHHVAYRLCVRFVADNPPEQIVTAAAETFTRTQGDIREVMRAILTHEAFWASSGQKLRRPIEYIAAMVRTLEIPAIDGILMQRAARGLDQPIMGWPTPDGYPDTAQAWINTNALLGRWNLAMQLTTNRRAQGILPWDTYLEELGNASAETVVDYFLDLILHHAIHPDDRAQLIAYLQGGQDHFEIDDPLSRRRIQHLVGLILASPYFQWR